MEPIPIERRGEYVVTMYELDDAVCRRLLERSRFGRVAFVGADGPEVLPVNALFDADSVLYRAARGSALDRFVAGHTVAFEADSIDPIAESGWSVLVRGRGAWLTDPERIAALADTDVHAWAPGARVQWIEITAEHMSGRVIRRQGLGGAKPARRE